MIQENRIDSIEIKEDEFKFTSNMYNGNRNYDPLSRLEFDTKLNKYFCQLNLEDLKLREYHFDIQARKFVQENLEDKKI